MARRMAPVRVLAEEYDIKKSLKYVKHLYPVLKDAHGHVIDGDHRLMIDPEWPVLVLDHIKTPTQLTSARIIANRHRRTVGREEMEEWINKLARSLLENDKVPRYEVLKTISEITGLSYRTVSRYISDNYKRSGGYERMDTVAIQTDEAEEPYEESPEEPATVEQVLSKFRRHEFHVFPQGSRDFIKYKLCKNFGFDEKEAERQVNAYLRATRQKQQMRAADKLVPAYKPPQDPRADLYDKLSRYYPTSILDQITKYTDSTNLETLVKYCRIYVEKLNLKAGSELRQTILEEMLK